MGELHLEIIVDRMMREFKVEANVGKPMVAYRETIRKRVDAEGKFVRQSGGRGQYGHVKMYVEPNEAGKGYEFINDIKGGVIPKEYIKPIDQGIQEAMQSGVLAGYPCVDIKITIYDGSYHDVDSNEMAFKIAGSMGFKAGCEKASPVILEPIMAVEVVVPEDYMGDVIGNLNSRRGPHREHGGPVRLQGGHRQGAPGRDVRLLHHPPRHDPGPRQLHHAVLALRRGSPERGRRNRGQGQGRQVA